jgi:hypothetical protein
MKTLRSIAAFAAVVLGFVGLYLVLVPKNYYEPGHSLMTVEYRLSDVKCYCMPHDTWGQYPILCASKDAQLLGKKK